ncbi:uncharacterized protein LOC144082472 isoform X3 [Stigmatopora argus]
MKFSPFSIIFGLLIKVHVQTLEGLQVIFLADDASSLNSAGSFLRGEVQSSLAHGDQILKVERTDHTKMILSVQI